MADPKRTKTNPAAENQGTTKVIPASFTTNVIPMSRTADVSSVNLSRKRSALGQSRFDKRVLRPFPSLVPKILSSKGDEDSLSVNRTHITSESRNDSSLGSHWKGRRGRVVSLLEGF